MKHLLPMPVRNLLRPGYQRAHRAWWESRWSRKPAEWTTARERAMRMHDFAQLLAMAGSEFGISQMPGEVRGLIDRVGTLKPQVVVEIGTHKGGNSFLFCHALAATREVIGIDLCVQNAAKLKFFARDGQRYRAFHGDSQTLRMRERARRALGGRPIDFLFIDGDHRYAGVRADFDLYSPLVRPGGLIAFHDICPDHRTLYGTETGCYAGEVHRFWAELKARHAKTEELVDTPGQDGFGIGILEWPGRDA